MFDAWNVYHAVPIREEDRHLFTFITPWGLFRYKRAPQGFLSSGDGYNRRFDEITSHVLRAERCVDDTLLYDDDPEANWWRAIEFLELCGKSGIVLNPEKFKFAEETVDFAGFMITQETGGPQNWTPYSMNHSRESSRQSKRVSRSLMSQGGPVYAQIGRSRGLATFWHKNTVYVTAILLAAAPMVGE